MEVKHLSLSSPTRRLTASVRVRSTLAGTAVILVGAIVGSVVLITLLQRTLTATVESNADARATEVTHLIGQGDLRQLDSDLEQNTTESQIVQVVDPTGEVIASSSVRAADRALSPLRPAIGRTVREESHRLARLHTKDPYIITIRGVAIRGGAGTIVIASSVASQSESVETLLTYLLILVPAAGVLVAIGMWVLVGRSLRPVERITSRVATIRSGRLGDRVPVPGSHDEIARLAVTMNEMLERLDTGQQVQQSFVSNASHELRSPLTSLTASLDVLGDSPSRAHWQDAKAVMTSEVNRMTRLVDDLLLLAKADYQGLPTRLEDVDLEDIVDQEVGRLRDHQRVEVTATITPVRVRGDRGRLTQVVRNLVENAVIAAAHTVRVTVGAVDGAAQISVEDDGPGIPVAQRQRVFERFVRLDESRSRDSGGSGLGLAIVREIVDSHGGTVTIAAAASGGARIQLRLPLDQPPAGSSR